MNNYQSDLFDKDYSNWWNPEGEFFLLHKINHIRNNFILLNINSHFSSNIKILDIGCGAGMVSSFLDSMGFDVVGIDPNPKTIEASIEHRDKNNLLGEYINSNLEDFVSYNSKKFDVILCLEVLEHVENVENFLFLIVNNLLANDGMLILSTINKTISAYLKLIVVCEYLVKLIPKNTHQYSKFLKPSTINNILTKYGMKFTSLDGLNFDLSTMKFFISKKIDSNYFLIYRKNPDAKLSRFKNTD